MDDIKIHIEDAEDIKMYLGSWNVGNACPPKVKSELSQWIPAELLEYDLVVIGLQESSYKPKRTSKSEIHAESYEANERDIGSTTSALSMEDDESNEDIDSDTIDVERGHRTDACEGNEASTDVGGKLKDGESSNVVDRMILKDEMDPKENVSDESTKDSDSNCVHMEENVNNGRVTSMEAEAVKSQHGRMDLDTLKEEAVSNEKELKKTDDEDSNEVQENRKPLKKKRSSMMMAAGKRASTVVKKTKSQLRMVMDKPYHFFQRIERHVGPNFEVAIKADLMEMRLIVFVNKRNTFSLLEKSSEATGVANVIGNKGGVMAKLCINDKTTFCFVNCHLAAHEGQKYLDRRNADCAEILRCGNIGNKLIDVDYQFHHTFLFGDLNYRISGSAEEDTSEKHRMEQWEKVMALIKDSNWKLLNDKDQLRDQIRNKRALTGWTLPEPEFPPTFKRERTYDPKYRKQRIPAYCDRILWKSLPGCSEAIEMSSFQSVEGIATSDHKPIFATFNVKPQRCLKAVSENPAECTLVTLSGFSGKNLKAMDLNGFSDPFLKFFIDPPHMLLYKQGSVESSTSLPGIPQSNIKMKTLNPIWKDRKLPTFWLKISDPDMLKGLHLIIVVRDFDSTSANDPMGQCALCLHTLWQSRTAEGLMKFSESIVFSGKPAGLLYGTLQFTFPGKKHNEMDNAVHKINGCHCIVQ